MWQKKHYFAALFLTWFLDTSLNKPSEERSHFFSMMNILGMEIPPQKVLKKVLLTVSFLPTAYTQLCFYDMHLMGYNIMFKKKKSGKGE